MPRPSALALAAAETGRLVLVGVSAGGAARRGCARLPELWEPQERPGVRVRLGRGRCAACSIQRLVVVSKAGKGRTAAAELLLVLRRPRGRPRAFAELSSRASP